MRQFQVLCVWLAVLSLCTSPASAVTCKSYSNCRQAVINWCQGNHPRADGDSDGIPCENVCSSKRQVDAIRREIGC
jgi:hypothetical protein